MIDLNHLTPLADITIKLPGNSQSINLFFGSESLCTQIYQDEWVNSFSTRPNPYQISIWAVNFDRIQLAEAVAASLEAQGLKVRRLIPNPSSIDKSATHPIQSFILC